MVTTVVLAKQANKDIGRAPRHVVDKLFLWVTMVGVDGLEATRKIPGFHDEPLKGARAGQRSIRLSRSWRAIYVIKQGTVEFVEVQEVNHHEY